MSGQVTMKTPQGRQVTSDLSSALTPEGREQARLDAIQFIKQLRLVPYDGLSMRERFTYRGDSLWWFTELYLHKMRRIDAAISTILALESLNAAHQPTRITIDSSDRAVRAAARAFAAASGVPVD